jgi:hypothetical protein
MSRLSGRRQKPEMNQQETNAGRIGDVSVISSRTCAWCNPSEPTALAWNAIADAGGMTVLSICRPAWD